jgi:hypothetical protein
MKKGARKRVYRQYLVFTIVLILSSGCAFDAHRSRGTTALADVDPTSLEAEFQPGKTTTKDVLDRLGPPSSKSETPGILTWQYDYSKDIDLYLLWLHKRAGPHKTIIFTFDPGSGVLQHIDFKDGRQ